MVLFSILLVLLMNYLHLGISNAEEIEVANCISQSSSDPNLVKFCTLCRNYWLLEVDQNKLIENCDIILNGFKDMGTSFGMSYSNYTYLLGVPNLHFPKCMPNLMKDNEKDVLNIFLDLLNQKGVNSNKCHCKAIFRNRLLKHNPQSQVSEEGLNKLREIAIVSKCFEENDDSECSEKSVLRDVSKLLEHKIQLNFDETVLVVNKIDSSRGCTLNAIEVFLMVFKNVTTSLNHVDEKRLNEVMRYSIMCNNWFYRYPETLVKNCIENLKKFIEHSYEIDNTFCHKNGMNTFCKRGPEIPYLEMDKLLNQKALNIVSCAADLRTVEQINLLKTVHRYQTHFYENNNCSCFFYMEFLNRIYNSETLLNVQRDQQDEESIKKRDQLIDEVLPLVCFNKNFELQCDGGSVVEAVEFAVSIKDSNPLVETINTLLPINNKYCNSNRFNSATKVFEMVSKNFDNSLKDEGFLENLTAIANHVLENKITMHGLNTTIENCKKNGCTLKTLKSNLEIISQ